MVSRLECAICFHYFDDFERLPKVIDECGHTFCYACLENWLNNEDTCPMCRTPINLTAEIPTNLELLSVFEKKKRNPKCSCHESRMYYCPTCLVQNYVDWDERRESGEHTFCFGCARNHFHEMEHKVRNLETDHDDLIEIESGECDTKEGAEEEKTKISSDKCRKYSIAVAVVAVGILSIAFTVSLCLLFNIISF
ncbi:hypothetical protein CRE_28368 [Caenorhabditis remanei]|uniref:RING-type domain-containing protein n=1 Tax=Caenorhabditis remanei TaxID=31234 RepID=E3LLZ3_CAERE|nr:hypothetical protein CRE_28368 [Caenorhabditis remanei]